jgi:hypothetical protein
MKYTVRTFVKGNQANLNLTKDASKHVDAIVIYRPNATMHYLVIGKTVKRFSHKKKEIKGPVKLFPYGAEGKYGILLMVGNLSEKYSFTYKSKRDEVLKTCTELMSANSANPGKQQTAITVYLGGTSGSESSSTEKKTSKDYVESAIPGDMWTASSTDGSSGPEDVTPWELPTWKAGFKTSPSKPNQTLYAKAKPLPHNSSAINSSMIAMEGKVIPLKKVSDSFYGNGYFWLPEWLEFEFEAKTIGGEQVKDNGHEDVFPGGIGQTLKFQYTEFKNWYKSSGWWYHKSWLESYPVNVIVKIIENPDSRLSYVTAMQRMIGKTYTAKKISKELYLVRNYYFHDNMLEEQ